MKQHILALLGGEPVRKKPFPPFPVMGKGEIDAVVKVLESGNLSTFHSSFKGGKKVREFENSFAEYYNVKHAIAVNSGTAALHIALAAAGIGPGDEVIIPAYTFTATATSVLHHNAVPVFADIDQRTFNINPESIKELVTPRTKALIPVHLHGLSADMDPIMEIADKYNLIVIEDNAQSPGAIYKGKKAGTIGHLGTFSLQETKNIMTGEGGMVITDDDTFAERCRLVRNHGEVHVLGKPREYLANILGWNYRMTEIEAAIGVEQIKKLDGLNEIRVRNGDYLTQKLAELEGVVPPYVPEDSKHVYHIYATIYNEDKFGVSRKNVLEALNAEGVQVWPGHPRPLYENPIFKEKLAYGDKGCPFNCGFYKGNIKYSSDMCPETEKVCSTVIAFGQIRPPATLDDMQSIVDAYSKVIRNIDELKKL